MDYLLNYLAGSLGVDPTTFILILGVVVSVCNLLGRLIPDDTGGLLGFVRKVCKVLGLYLSNRVTGSTSVNDAARNVVAKTKSLQSPWFVGIIALLFALLLSGCTALQKERVTSTLSAICTNAPLAQALYNGALASHDNRRVNEILNVLQASCPAVLIVVQTVPVRESAAPPPPPTQTPGPERG
jgi:hypothetical protein